MPFKIISFLLTTTHPQRDGHFTKYKLQKKKKNHKNTIIISLTGESSVDSLQQNIFLVTKIFITKSPVFHRQGPLVTNSTN